MLTHRNLKISVDSSRIRRVVRSSLRELGVELAPAHRRDAGTDDCTNVRGTGFLTCCGMDRFYVPRHRADVDA